MLVQHSVLLAASPAVVFDWLLQPPVHLELSAAELHLELVEGPARFTLGALTTWKARRWGIAATIVQEVAALEDNRLLVLEQRQGPLRRLRHEFHVRAEGEGTLLEDRIDVEGPGGLLGLVLTEGKVRRDLEAMLGQRDRKLRQRCDNQRMDPKDQGGD